MEVGVIMISQRSASSTNASIILLRDEVLEELMIQFSRNLLLDASTRIILTASQITGAELEYCNTPNTAFVRLLKNEELMP